MWPAPKLEPSTRTSTPLRGGADYLRLPGSQSSIVSIALIRVRPRRAIASVANQGSHAQAKQQRDGCRQRRVIRLAHLPGDAAVPPGRGETPECVAKRKPASTISGEERNRQLSTGASWPTGPWLTIPADAHLARAGATARSSSDPAPASPRWNRRNPRSKTYTPPPGGRAAARSEWRLQAMSRSVPLRSNALCFDMSRSMPMAVW